MASTYYSKAALTQQPGGVGWAGQHMTAIGTVILADTEGTTTITSGPVSGDKHRMIRLPQGAVITGGRLTASRFASGTSAASTTVALNIGLTGAFKTVYAKTSYGAASASQALGVTVPIDFSEASVGSIKAESGLNMSLGGLLYTVGPLQLSEDQYAQIAWVGSGTSFISGSLITLEVNYYMAVHA